MAQSAEAYKEFFENNIVPPSWKDKVWDKSSFKKFHESTSSSKEAIEKWWEKWANELFWFKKWSKVLDDSNPPFYRWFIGGETNLAYLATDWQIEKGRKNKLALIWEGELWDETLKQPKEVKKFTYYDLFRESNVISYALKEKLKVKKGEILTFYLPMIPELPFYMLAVQRLGAEHSIVFSGFSAEALASRVLDSGSRIIVTADGLYRRGKIVALKPIVDEAIKICEKEGLKIEKVVVVKRTGSDIPWNTERDIWHHELIANIPPNVSVPVEKRREEDAAFILYTSGTTGTPKAVQHSVGGYAVGLYATMKMLFDAREDDIFWCTADVGWITGHSYVVYGPLITGLTTVMYEGSPDYPEPDRWWSIIERYGVTLFYTAPTAIRMLMRFPEDYVKKHDLSTLRVVHTVGEPINPEAFLWYFKNLGRENIVASSAWWMTETGHIITGHFPGLGKIFPLKPGTNGYSIPGVTVDVVDDDGNPCPPGVRGYFVITSPWPGMLETLYKNPQRYIDAYWSRFKGKRYFYTGDFAVKDPDGYIWVLGRADDVIKVAGHRIGTAEVESALARHPAVAEAACVGKSDPVKGQVPVIFTVLKKGFSPSQEFENELKKYLRSTIGPVVASDAIITFVESVPKTRSGKIMRRLLRAVVEGATLGDVTTLEDGVAVEEAKRAYETVKSAISGQKT
ncbi:MAG: acetate--CoA ligase [Nitrososphaerota archaeon]|nr:acetate--CoA ligase [Candidatus Bathyarchaeota archaeon]MDW8022463.1 acetate--CoA ligase [Nitrososphaerota archaeon]